ncbi:hypothetical protein GCM10009555_075230 [Acrocarpospora macrocephala]|uniref:Serine aminopeptidase S33 domain-containing protein n=1 Tax=Acrocarpospora macrocephala TaxID=150177 RepID=A0A5M3X007_9ACTN|nr:hypothetical protein [Acrocarpospora macrocephala]GES14484.1 hypothetical protein Amac_080810 [Acrocarpospora macrocephala]
MQAHEACALPIYSDTGLAGMTMPMLVIAGDRDAFIKGPETARRIRANVPKDDVRLLSGVRSPRHRPAGTIGEFIQ